MAITSFLIELGISKDGWFVYGAPFRWYGCSTSGGRIVYTTANAITMDNGTFRSTTLICPLCQVEEGKDDLLTHMIDMHGAKPNLSQSVVPMSGAQALSAGPNISWTTAIASIRAEATA